MPSRHGPPDCRLWQLTTSLMVALGLCLGLPPIVVADPAGTQQFDVGLDPGDLVEGPDGKLWFTERGFPGFVGRINPDGSGLTEFPAAGLSPPGSSGSNQGRVTPLALASAAGNLWLGASRDLPTDASFMAKVTPAGSITEYDAGGGAPSRPVLGSDGNLWFTISQAPGGTDADRHIVKMDPATGAMTHITAPFNAGFFTDSSITAGPDGALWFTAAATPSGGGSPNGVIGRITTAGDTTFFRTGLPDGFLSLRNIVVGPDGNMWFTIDVGSGAAYGSDGSLPPGRSRTIRFRQGPRSIPCSARR